MLGGGVGCVVRGLGWVCVLGGGVGWVVGHVAGCEVGVWLGGGIGCVVGR